MSLVSPSITPSLEIIFYSDEILYNIWKNSHVTLTRRILEQLISIAVLFWKMRNSNNKIPTSAWISYKEFL